MPIDGQARRRRPAGPRRRARRRPGRARAAARRPRRSSTPEQVAGGDAQRARGASSGPGRRDRPPSPSGPAGRSRSASTSRAAGSVSSSRVSARLAAATATNAVGQRLGDGSEPVAGRAPSSRSSAAPDGGRRRRPLDRRRARSSDGHAASLSTAVTPAAPVALDVWPGSASPLCQLNTVGRRPRRQRRPHPRRARRGRGRRLRPRRLPRAGHHRLPARGPAAEAGLRRRQPAGARPGGRARPASCAAVVGLRRRRPRPLQRRRRLRRRPGAGRLPQAPPAQLRGVRRAALLRRRHGRRAAGRGRRRAGRRVDLRGRLEPHRPHRRPGRRRRRARRQHQRLAVLRRPPGRAGAHAGDPGGRRVVRPRLRQPGRRPGRAGLRRRVDGVRRRTASCWPGPASSPRRRMVFDVEVRPVFRKRLLDPRGRATRAAAPGRRRVVVRAAGRRPGRPPAPGSSPSR